MTSEITFTIPVWLIYLWVFSGLITVVTYWHMEMRGRATFIDIIALLILFAGGPLVCFLVPVSVVVSEYWGRISAKLTEKLEFYFPKVDRVLDYPLSCPGLEKFLEALLAHYEAVHESRLPTYSQLIASPSIKPHYSALLITIALNKMYSRPWLAENVQNRIAKVSGYKILAFKDHSEKDAQENAFPKILASYIQIHSSQNALEITATRIVDCFLKMQSMPPISKSMQKTIITMLEVRMEKWISRCLDEVGQDPEDYLDIPMLARSAGQALSEAS